MSDLMAKIKKNSRIKDAEVISKSKYFKDGWRLNIPTAVPMLNVALSGEFDGGLQQGILMIVGDSRTFKTGFLLETAKAFLTANPEDGVIIFYDSEFGAGPEYFESRGVDMDRVLHCPIATVEDLKFDLAAQLKGMDEKDNVMILVDSIGNLASDKEADDAEEGKSKADMTRAKSLNSMFRIITPHLNKKRIPLACINHFYNSQDGNGAIVVSGGKKAFLSADDIWYITRSQEKEGRDLKGWSFNVNIEKSRTCREKVRIPIIATYEDGLKEYSGLMDEAIEFGVIRQLSSWYIVQDITTGEWNETKKRRKQIEKDKEFFNVLMAHEPFKQFIRDKYLIDPNRG